ncbi:hypothetical protein [Streptomyces sp. NPDC001165]|uniref:hypothetical protein n=1 Tax=Streptomyces sp. NPDC001165 TaxID=3364546 RepID=UPI00368E5BE1
MRTVSTRLGGCGAAEPIRAAMTRQGGFSSGQGVSPSWGQLVTWWNAFDVPAEKVCAGPLVTADIDETQYADLLHLVTNCPHDELTYARAQLLLADWLKPKSARQERDPARRAQTVGRL